MTPLTEAQARQDLKQRGRELATVRSDIDSLRSRLLAMRRSDPDAAMLRNELRVALAQERRLAPEHDALSVALPILRVRDAATTARDNLNNIRRAQTPVG